MISCPYYLGFLFISYRRIYVPQIPILNLKALFYTVLRLLGMLLLAGCSGKG